MRKIWCLLFCMVVGIAVFAQQNPDIKKYHYTIHEWRHIARHGSDVFFRTDEAKRIGENVLAYQRVTGGWPKNIVMHKPLGSELDVVLSEKGKRYDSTTDNNATILEMTYLAKLYRQVPDSRYKKAFVKGVNFLLNGQYKNGGWPQFWPENHGYQVHITYNDNAMLQTMQIIKNLRDGVAPFSSLIDDKLHERLVRAFDNGITCILNTQIVVDGGLTVWCQQHDRVTLKPTAARSYELASFCPAESARLVALLMDIPDPDDRIKRAVTGAMRWFDEHKIEGIRVERYTADDGQPDVRVVSDANAKPTWARYYDLETEEPFFCDRDGVPCKTLAEVGYERRNGYSWYSQEPADLKDKYDVWKKKYDM